jgi:hypothetical protein
MAALSAGQLSLIMNDQGAGLIPIFQVSNIFKKNILKNIY